MGAFMFVLIFAVVLGAAVYSRLPLTVVSMTSMVAFMSSLQPHGEPLNSLLLFARVPALVVTDVGSSVFGIGAPIAAGILLVLTLATDVVLTNAMGVRR